MENYHCWHLPHDILYSSTANEQPVLQNTFLICSNHLSLRLSTQNTFQHWQQHWVAWFSYVQQGGISCSHIHEYDNKASLYNHNCRWSKTLLLKGLCRFDEIWNVMEMLANNSNLKFHKRHCSRPLVKCPRGPKITPHHFLYNSKTYSSKVCWSYSKDVSISLDSCCPDINRTLWVWTHMNYSATQVSPL
jgi:hypothetical protein